MRPPSFGVHSKALSRSNSYQQLFEFEDDPFAAGSIRMPAEPLSTRSWRSTSPRSQSRAADIAPLSIDRHFLGFTSERLSGLALTPISPSPSTISHESMSSTFSTLSSSSTSSISEAVRAQVHNLSKLKKRISWEMREGWKSKTGGGRDGGKGKGSRGEHYVKGKEGGSGMQKEGNWGGMGYWKGKGKGKGQELERVFVD